MLRYVLARANLSDEPRLPPWFISYLIKTKQFFVHFNYRLNILEE